jgi:iron complex outermembrane receptor protein
MAFDCPFRMQFFLPLAKGLVLTKYSWNYVNHRPPRERRRRIVFWEKERGSMSRTHLRAALFATVSMQFLAGGQALAQSSEGATADSTIIVTARRIEERLQDVPISMSVVDQERLSKANVSSSEDLAKVVPGLNVDSRYSSEQSTFAIRGFSQQLRTSASVGTYFGEVVAPRGSGLSLQGGDGAGPGSLFDLQNVQVLKGPQGTLFGRNTTGGAVILTPRKPTSRFEGYVEGSMGNYDMRRIQAVVNLPLADWARLRLGVDRQLRDGYAHNVSGFGPKDFYDVDYVALRGSLVLDITPNVENYTILSYLHSDTNGSVPQLFRANPNIPGSRGTFGRAAVPQVNRLNTSGDPYQIEQKLNNPRALTKQFQAINTTTWRATDNLTVKNIMSYSTHIQDLRQDIFGTNFLIPALGSYISTAFSFNPDGFHTSDQRNFTEELQVQGNAADGRLTYQAGLYFEHSTPGQLTASESPSIGAVCLTSVAFTNLATTRCMSGPAGPNKGSIEFINMAAYGQATYALTDQLKFTAGIRYTYDRAKGMAQGFDFSYRPATPFTFVAPTPNATTANPAACSTGYPIATNCVFTGRTSDKKPTWTLTAQYSPTDDIMAYGTYSRGYKQGGVTPFALAGVPFYAPEKLDNYEIGAKLSFDGSIAGNLNVAGFYSKLADQQILLGLTDNDGILPSGTSVINAGKSRMYGVEFDGQLRFAGLFRLDAAATYLNTKIESLNLPDFTVFPFSDYEVRQVPAVGGPLELAPKWSVNVGGTFIVPTSEDLGKIELSAFYRYTSAYLTGGPTGSSTPVKQLDLNLDWRNVGGQPLDLAVFATNVTNQFTRSYVQGLFNSFGFDTGYLGTPRMYGVRVKIRFGEGQ